MSTLPESLAASNALTTSGVKSITRTNWPLGWTPSADAVNGDPQGLLRMDNLRIDKDGVVGLIDGRVGVFQGLPNFVSGFYSKILNGQENFWLAFGAPITGLVRYTGVTPSYNIAQTPGASSNIGYLAPGFGEALGRVLISAGQLRVKDDGLNPLPLGLIAPNQFIQRFGYIGPTCNAIQPLLINVTFPNLYNVSGSIQNIGPNGFQLVTASDPQNPNINASGMATTINIINLSNYPTPGYDPDTDIFALSFSVLDQPPSDIVYIELIFFLNGNPNAPATWDSYYRFVWTQDDLNKAIINKSPLQALRSQFSYNGTTGYSWQTVVGTGVYVQTVQPATCFVGGTITITGKDVGGLDGIYNYIQVNVANNGTYLAKSPVSLLGYDALQSITAAVTGIFVHQGSVQITPIRNDPNANEYWFFRQADPTAPIDPNTGMTTNNSVLPWNFVGKMLSSSGGIFTDNLSDAAVIQNNIDQSNNPNFALQTLNVNDAQHSPFSGAPNALQDNIYAIEGMYKTRMLYMGSQFIYISDSLDPDAIDTRLTIKPSGDAVERNLWLKKVTNDVIVLGTTKTLYEISGTFAILPDGTPDIIIRDLGESHPPMSIDVCNYNGGLYYVASDGLRVTIGSNSVNISPQLRHLFLSSTQSLGVNALARHGVNAVRIYPGQGFDVRYSIAAAHNKIYFVLPLIDGTSRLCVYDAVKQNYNLEVFPNANDPLRVFSTQADELLASIRDTSGNALYVIDVLSGQGVNRHTTGISFMFRTVFDHFGTPKNRKDLYTLKITGDTGNSLVGVGIQRDGIGVSETDEGSYQFLGIFSSNGLGTTYFPLGNSPNITLGNRYSVQLNDYSGGVFTFKLYEVSFEYDLRPEQVTFTRILPTNLGTVSRKRITNLPFTIDTLGNNVTFQPLLDNTGQQIALYNTPTKQTLNYTFAQETIATDIGGSLQGGPFEFYGINFEEIVSEKLPVPRTFLLIPPNNYGTPNRKRHSSYKFQIDTRGNPVVFTPILDGVNTYPTKVFNTTGRKTVEYYFNTYPEAIDIGGTLLAQSGLFEFYDVVIPQTVEVLPDKLTTFKIPYSNMGIAAPKRIRSIPLVINTFGSPVQFLPAIDGNYLFNNISTFNTQDKITVIHYFNTDVFATDIGGLLTSAANPPVPFEFYGIGDAVAGAEGTASVEVLPVAKKFDQIGPVAFDKIGKIFGFRVRLIMNGSTTNLNYAILGDTAIINGQPLISGQFPVLPGVDFTYEVYLPKNINANIVRLTLGPSVDTFVRYSCKMKVQASGMQSQSQWLEIR